MIYIMKTLNTKAKHLEKSDPVNDVVICAQPPLIRGPALVTSLLRAWGERPLMVSKVTSDDELNIRYIPVSETVICQQ